MNIFGHIVNKRNNWQDIQQKIQLLKSQNYLFPYSPAHMEEVGNLFRELEPEESLINKNIAVISQVSSDVELLPGRPSLNKILQLRNVFTQSQTPISQDIIEILNATEQEWIEGKLSCKDLQTRLTRESPKRCLVRVLNDFGITDFSIQNDVFHMGRKNRKYIKNNFAQINTDNARNVESFIELRERLGIDVVQLDNLSGPNVFLHSGVAKILQDSYNENGSSIDKISYGQKLIENHELLEEHVTLCMNVLDKAGYFPDKENDVLKLRSRMNDVSHAIYGATTTFFISDDERFRRRLSATYAFLKIPTTVLNVKDFITM